MHIKIIVLSLIVIIGLVGGGIVALKNFYKPNIEPNAISVVIKANDTVGAITVPYNDSIKLSWESNNAVHCEISGNWSEIVPGSGSRLIENITEAKNYLLLCVNEKNETASSSVVIYIDEKTISANVTSTVSAINRDSLKNFSYTWNKNFGFGSKNDLDVVALQKVLFSEYLLSSDQITGNFDEQTLIALKKFQKAYFIEQTGYARPKTISVLNELYGAGASTYLALSSDSSNQYLISGTETVVTINLRDDNCQKIGAVTTGTSLKITSDEIKYCVIADEKFQMREAQVISDGRIGWIAADYLGESLSGGTVSSGATTTPVLTSIPTVDIKANNSDKPITVGVDSEVSLSWESSNVESCVGSSGWSGEKSIDGTELISNLVKSRYYTLTCSGKNGSVSDSVTVYVSAGIASSITSTTSSIATSTSPVVDLKVNNSSSVTISKNSSVNLSWTSRNVSSCNASRDWLGEKSLDGSESISNLTEYRYYTLTCSGDAGSVSDSVSVYISSIASPTYPASSDDKTASSEENQTFGGMVTNVSPCTIPPRNNSVQILGKEGGRFIWKMGESKLENALTAIFGSKDTTTYAPYTIPEVGMWLIGELGEKVDCYGAGGPGKVIIFAEFDFDL
ncbi:MAG: peptidoglycan-binding domain-containing protein [Patescibacteria group bacterium]